MAWPLPKKEHDRLHEEQETVCSTNAAAKGFLLMIVLFLSSTGVIRAFTQHLEARRRERHHNNTSFKREKKSSILTIPAAVFVKQSATQLTQIPPCQQQDPLLYTLYKYRYGIHHL